MSVPLADLKMNRLLDRIDEWAEESRIEAEVDSIERFDNTRLEDNPPLQLNLQEAGIKTVLWATGFRPDYSWLDVPVLDRKGRVLHDGGVVDGAPGMYLLGIQFLRKRKSALIDGAGDDAHFLSDHLVDFLKGSDGAG